MPAGRIGAALEGLNLDLLIALDMIVPVILNRVRVRDEAAVAVSADIRTTRALGEWARASRLLRSGLLSAAEDVTRVEAEQQGEHEDDQSGAAADRDLSAV